MAKKCPHCDKKIIGHPNKKFCNAQHKDAYWNMVNPRGMFAHLNPANPEYLHEQIRYESDQGWDAHKDTF